MYLVLCSYLQFQRPISFQFLKYFQIREPFLFFGKHQNETTNNSPGYLKNFKEPVGLIKEPVKNQGFFRLVV